MCARKKNSGHAPGLTAIASSATSASAQRNPLGHGTHAGASRALAATAPAASTAGVARVVPVAEIEDAADATTVAADVAVRIIPIGHTQRVKVASATAGAWHAQHWATAAGSAFSAAAESAAPIDGVVFDEVAGRVLVLTRTVIMDLLLAPMPAPPPHGAQTKPTASEPGSHCAMAAAKRGAQTVCANADASSIVGVYE